MSSHSEEWARCNTAPRRSVLMGPRFSVGTRKPESIAPRLSGGAKLATLLGRAVDGTTRYRHGHRRLDPIRGGRRDLYGPVVL